MQLFDYQRLSVLMKQAGLDLVLANSPTNVRYLLNYYPHGIYSTSWLLDDGSRFYQSFVGLPADDRHAPFFTPWVGEAGYLSEHEPWVQDRHFYGDDMPIPGVQQTTNAPAHPEAAAIIAIRDRNLSSARIGVEMASLPAGSYDMLRSELPRARFTDAGPLLARLRSIKCTEEIRRLRVAAGATEQAISTAYDLVQEGTTELAFERSFKVALAGQGADFAWAHVAFGPKGASDITPRDVAARPGQPLRVDVGGTFGGYVCDMSRVGVLGDPAPELTRVMEAAHDTYRAVRGAVKAGVRAGALHELGTEVMNGRGYPLFTFLVGHGIGQDVHEWPVLVKQSDDFLESGMVVCVEIALRIQGLGSINIEDMVHVTDDGCESITTLSPEIYRIADQK